MDTHGRFEAGNAIVVFGDGGEIALRPAQPILRDIARDHAIYGDDLPVIAADFGRFVDQRSDAMAALDQACADLAADQSGGSGDEDVQQQAAGEAGVSRSPAPKGTAIPQSGNTP